MACPARVSIAVAQAAQVVRKVVSWARCPAAWGGRSVSAEMAPATSWLCCASVTSRISALRKGTAGSGTGTPLVCSARRTPAGTGGGDASTAAS